MITPERVAHWINVLGTEEDRARRQRQTYALPTPWVPDLVAMLGDVLVALQSDRAPGGCMVCGAPIDQKPRGRPRRYCSRPCRDRAARAA